ncbi:MAG: GGDEF domain-containing protein [Myxococcales bacterium]|nr:GGDEF domain-containing protein [Myxococcales bacterium]
MSRRAGPGLGETLISVQRDSYANALPGDWLLIVMAGPHVGQIFPLIRSKPITVIGRGDDVDVQILDGEVSRRHAAIRFDAERQTFLVSDLRSRNGTRVNKDSCESERPLALGDKIKLGTHNVLRASSGVEAEAIYAQRMYDAVLRDALTSVFNRRYFDERIDNETAFAKRHGEALSLLILDIDHFKAVNDTFGHQTGDAMLQHFAQIVQEQVRVEDVVARYGGEEFAVICRLTDEVHAAILGERLRAATESSPLPHADGPLAVTVSIGIAGLPSADIATASKLIACADSALYAAKHGGRNRVTLYGSLPPAR